MSEFLYPLATVVLDFFCVLFCIRLSVSRRGPVWLLGAALSVALLFGGVVTLIAAASNIAGETLTAVASYISVYLFAISVLWLITIIGFTFKTKPDKFLADSKKAENEDIYMRKRQKVTYRRTIDKRATAAAPVRKSDPAMLVRRSIDTVQKKPTEDYDPYTGGPVATVSPKRTGF